MNNLGEISDAISETMIYGGIPEGISIGITVRVPNLILERIPEIILEKFLNSRRINEGILMETREKWRNPGNSG